MDDAPVLRYLVPILSQKVRECFNTFTKKHRNVPILLQKDRRISIAIQKCTAMQETQYVIHWHKVEVIKKLI